MTSICHLMPFFLISSFNSTNVSSLMFFNLSIEIPQSPEIDYSSDALLPLQFLLVFPNVSPESFLLQLCTFIPCFIPYWYGEEISPLSLQQLFMSCQTLFSALQWTEAQGLSLFLLWSRSCLRSKGKDSSEVDSFSLVYRYIDLTHLLLKTRNDLLSFKFSSFPGQESCCLN